MRKIVIITVVSFFVSLQSAYSQIVQEEVPISLQRSLDTSLKEKKGYVNLLPPDVNKALSEDYFYQKNRPNGFQRTSIPIPVYLDSSKDGIWFELEDGGKLWQINIHADNALALDIVFSKFWLPPKGKFFIFNPTTNEAIGAITSQFLSGERIRPHRFSTGIVKGDDLILEYYQPVGEQEEPIITVESVYYTYIPAPDFNTSCDDEVNVNCSEGSNWQLEKNAIALVYIKFEQGGGWCSGSLINNTQNDQSPLFLTANHCLEYDLSYCGGYLERKDAVDDDDLSDWVFYWGYELPNCNATTQPCYSKTTIGAYVKANNSCSDFALLELQQDPLDILGYVPYYLGWDASGNTGTGGVCIHHPKGDVKKISTYTCTPSTSSTSYWSVQWISTVNGYGVTEKGSSGSPLINSNHKVIGQLQGGDSGCTNLTGSDRYGKLCVSWTGDGNSDYRRRLNYWLDPNGTNVQSINGSNALNIVGPDYIVHSTITGEYSIANLPSAYNVEWSLSDAYYNQNCLQQNYPSTNKCTITRAQGHDMWNATLTATIKYNGATVCTLEKTGVYVYYDFSGTYTSGDITNIIDYTHVFYIRANQYTYISSPNLYGATASYDSNAIIPLYWTFIPENGYISFFMPSVGNSYPVVINVVDCCGYYYQLYAIPRSNMENLNISIADQSLSITINEGYESSQNRGVDQPWSFEVRSATTGEQIMMRLETSKSATVSTSGWPKGIYIVKLTCGDEEMTEKIVLK